VRRGIDPKAFAAELSSSDSAGRAGLWTSFRAWIRVGAQAQGWRGYLGMALALIGALLAAFAFLDCVGAPEIYACAALLFLPGALLTRAGWRREREWRRANPFADWRRRR
jgi:hypothetical protein